MIKAGTIQSKEPFSRTSGRRMGEALIEKMGMRPDACWLFCSPGDHLPSMVKGVCEAVGIQTLIGCTTAGEICSDGFSTGAAVLGGIASDQIDFEIVSVDTISRNSEEAGRDLASAFSDAVRYVQLFSDGVTGNGSAMLRGITTVLGRNVCVSGGTSGDAGRFVKTFQFMGDRVLSDAAVAIGFSGDFKVGTGVQSGWSPIGLPKKVTRATGNVLYELNGESALNVYERFLGKHAQKLPAVGVEYPLGIIDQFENLEDGDHLLLRATMSVNRDDGSIQFAGEIPEGAMVYLTCGDRNAILDATERAVGIAIDNMGRMPRPSVAFFYSCMARKTVLGLRTKEEFERVCAQLDPAVPVMGFYTYGEYCPARCGGPSLLHNETATIALIGD